LPTQSLAPFSCCAALVGGHGYTGRGWPARSLRPFLHLYPVHQPRAFAGLRLRLSWRTLGELHGERTGVDHEPLIPGPA